jgi:hypothetical protein
MANGKGTMDKTNENEIFIQPVSLSAYYCNHKSMVNAFNISNYVYTINKKNVLGIYNLYRTMHDDGKKKIIHPN